MFKWGVICRIYMNYILLQPEISLQVIYKGIS